MNLVQCAVLAALCLAGDAAPGALRCTPGTDSSCSPEEVERPVSADEASAKEIENVDAECLPGSEWDSNCFHCRCSASARAECSPVDGCEKGTSEEPLRCAPNSTFPRGCNSCICLESGSVLCTLQACSGPDEAPLPVEIKDDSSRKDLVLELDDTESRSDKEDSNKDLSKLHNDNEPVQMERSIEDLDYTLNSPKGLEEVFPLPDQNNVLEDTDYADFEKSDRHKMVKRSACKAGAEFRSDCNSCKCSPDGRSYSCSHNECMDGDRNKEVEVFMESEGVDHAERHAVCAARGTFYIGCNTCRCNAAGSDYSCTNKPCALPDDVELFHELKVPKAANASKVVCAANRMFIMECNTCWCNEDGTGFFCTRKVCVQDLPDESDTPEEIRVLQRQCRPGEVFELDCNTCRCNPDGRSFSCTRRACADALEDATPQDDKNPSLIRKTRGAGAQSEAPKQCQPGAEFRLDCNKCVCAGDGRDFSCTRNDCSNGNGNAGSAHSHARARRDTAETVAAACAAGSVFERGCNVCRCAADGAHALCSHRRCPPPPAAPPAAPAAGAAATTDEPAKLSEADPSFRCRPGEQVRRGCNDCSCSADGRSVFCTVRLCDRA